jgi:class 3 adenylate cyclase
MRNLYPAGLAARMRGGVPVTAEAVSNVTVIVTWMDGLDGLAGERDAVAIRNVLNTLLDTINTAAAAHGVEPMRSLGETHIAVCGLSSPLLDHASRALAWTRAATTAVQRLGTDWAGSVSLRFGLASGQIDVLVLDRGHAAYDIWGRTLSIARHIAVEAEPGSVRVGESTYKLLTDVEGFAPNSPIADPVFGTIRTWTQVLAKRPRADAFADTGSDSERESRAAE